MCVSLLASAGEHIAGCSFPGKQTDLFSLLKTSGVSILYVRDTQEANGGGEEVWITIWAAASRSGGLNVN